MKIRVSCDDKYEAQKLASLIFIKDSKETYIDNILNVIENELVVSLKDKSAHSIVLENKENVENLADFMQSVIEKEHKIIATETFSHEVEITKN
ncbi:MAG: hypothetical protein R3327_04330 [Nitrosopumilaceae archaeon]|nr:hypothetical protein [Nitrosopumilaceae archaeon]